MNHPNNTNQDQFRQFHQKKGCKVETKAHSKLATYRKVNDLLYNYLTAAQVLKEKHLACQKVSPE